MTARILSTVLGAALLIAPSFAQNDAKPSPTNRPARTQPNPSASQTPQSQSMQEAIAFERHKEEAAAQQARREARHPSVTYNNQNGADRDAADAQDHGRPVKDEKAPGAKPGK